jgi:hypothetical protein
MMCGAICGGDDETGPWKRTRGKGRVYVECCNRLAPMALTESQHYSAYQGYVAGRRYRCLSDAGCNVNPGYKRTAHLRWYEFTE